ncbi:Dimethyl-sulfide monooxygenase [Fusarium oxysporum f. sp. albedinis]|nr:Dimethyl-sulfide monooxygenase [Fusarium oxysporum f. sp. albedinis]
MARTRASHSTSHDAAAWARLVPHRGPWPSPDEGRISNWLLRGGPFWTIPNQDGVHSVRGHPSVAANKGQAPGLGAFFKGFFSGVLISIVDDKGENDILRNQRNKDEKKKNKGKKELATWWRISFSSFVMQFNSLTLTPYH